MLQIGQQVRLDATDANGNHDWVYGRVRGFSFGGVMVRVEVMTHPEPETFEYLTADVEKWQE